MLATYWQNVKKVGKCVVNITNNSKMSDTFHRYRIESWGRFAYVEFTTKVQTKKARFTLWFIFELLRMQEVHHTTEEMNHSEVCIFAQKVGTFWAFFWHVTGMWDKLFCVCHSTNILHISNLSDIPGTFLPLESRSRKFGNYWW